MPPTSLGPCPNPCPDDPTANVGLIVKRAYCNVNLKDEGSAVDHEERYFGQLHKCGTKSKVVQRFEEPEEIESDEPKLSAVESMVEVSFLTNSLSGKENITNGNHGRWDCR